MASQGERRGSSKDKTAADAKAEAEAKAKAEADAKAKTAGAPVEEQGPYKDISDKTEIRPGKKFTPTQHEKILAANRERNGGKLKSDDPNDPFQDLSDPVKSVSLGMGGQPQDPAMAAIDHIKSRKDGGTNSYGNARVISTYFNNLLRAKGIK